MKCPNCGGELNLEDPYCAHCGAPNELAQRHIKDMNQYRQEFDATRQEVRRETNRMAGRTVRITILAVLIFLCVLVSVILRNSYSIQRSYQEHRAKRNYKTYSAQMDAYLEDGDYENFYAFCYANNISAYSDAYEEYTYLIREAGYYHYVAQDIRELIMDEENSYRTKYSRAQDLADELNYYYRYQDEEYLYTTFSEREKDVFADMNENIGALLQTYVGLTDEEIAGLPDLSEDARSILIGGKYAVTD